LQDMDEIPPVGNITPNETRVQIKISKEESMRIADEVSAELSSLEEKENL